MAIRRVEVGIQGFADDAGLFVDFLQHEMAKPALAHRGSRPGGNGDFWFDDVPRRISHCGAVTGENSPVAVLQIGHPVGERGQRKGIRSQKHPAITPANDQRAAPTGGNQQIFLAGE